MPRVRFLDDFDYHLPAYNRRVTRHYVKGMELSVTRDCARKAKKAGKAEIVRDGVGSAAGNDE